MVTLSMHTRKPRRLREGDTLLIIAPSSNINGVSEEQIKQGVKNLGELGLNAVIHPNCGLNYKGTSGPPRERAKVLMEAFKSESVDGIMCFWGGWNSNDLLDYLDWGLIRANPKVFIGYSDITVLNTVLREKSGLINFQGPAFITFTHSFLLPWEVEVFRDVLMKPSMGYQLRPSPIIVDDPYYYLHPEKPIEEKNNPGWHIIREGQAQGEIIGGHIGSLLTLAGTGYWPELAGKLLLLEMDETGNPKILRRQFKQLEHIGVFDEINGLLIGRVPEVTGVKDDQWVGALLDDIFSELDYPIVADMDFGHTNPIATVPIGVNAIISTEKKVLTYLDSCTR